MSNAVFFLAQTPTPNTSYLFNLQLHSRATMALQDYYNLILLLVFCHKFSNSGTGDMYVWPPSEMNSTNPLREHPMPTHLV